MKIAIHQPNFIPWYPFFQKIEAADIFVILSNCQFEKNNFQNRFNMNEKWFTMSTNKGLEKINKKIYVNPNRDWIKIKKTLYNYNLEIFNDCISESLYNTNKNIIKKICKLLNIKTKIVEDYDTNLKGTERLIDICKSLNAKSYISGIGGKKYMESNLFSKHNIELIFQNEKDMIKKPVLEILKEKKYV